LAASYTLTVSGLDDLPPNKRLKLAARVDHEIVRKTLRAVHVAPAIAVFAISSLLLGERVPELSPSP
jgi:hypothetical protein